MDEILALRDIDFVSWIIISFAILSVIVAMCAVIKKFCEIIGMPVKWVRKKNADHELLMQTAEKMNEYADNRVRDRQQSLSIQKELIDAQNGLSKSIEIISEKLDKMQRNTDERFLATEKKNNKRIRAELKDKISQLYRYYHSLGKINDMELESLEDLIEEYEAADGVNSFVHQIVQKEMYTWEKIDKI